MTLRGEDWQPDPDVAAAERHPADPDWLHDGD